MVGWVGTACDVKHMLVLKRSHDLYAILVQVWFQFQGVLCVGDAVAFCSGSPQKTGITTTNVSARRERVV